MNEIKKSSLFQSIDGQAIKVPAGFEMPGTEVTVTKDGERLIVEPTGETSKGPLTWAELLDQMETIDVDWPDVDEGLLPLDDIKL
ncbi:antitoxin [Devosia sp. Root635]|uniref:antitoxin n=1 Tax=Devosia sp. Root635 TaxID=1736575 RepID=UPI0019108B5E|nr:AbrB/MazE/SpoVT family DNA-binding domain-containing protein [Devosia sp. Root635]